jgi:hypothetical protein
MEKNLETKEPSFLQKSSVNLQLCEIYGYYADTVQDFTWYFEGQEEDGPIAEDDLPDFVGSLDQLQGSFRALVYEEGFSERDFIDALYETIDEDCIAQTGYSMYQILPMDEIASAAINASAYTRALAILRMHNKKDGKHYD